MRVLVLLAACAAAASAASDPQLSAEEEAQFQALLAKRAGAAKKTVVRRDASSPQIKVVDGKLLSVVDGDEFDHGDMASATKVKSVSTICVARAALPWVGLAAQ